MLHTETLSGWARYPSVESRVARPETRSALHDLFSSDAGSVRPSNRAPNGTLLARGGGRSYGDAALNGTGTTVVTRRLDRMVAFDAQSGTLRAEAGVTLGEVLNTFVPRGWFLPVTPGTKEATLGGAVAFDVHGKNHHGDGGFSAYVRELSLLLASGEEVTCSPNTRPNLFWATVSGGGLTGIITEVELQMRRIETARLVTRHVKADDFDDLLRLFDEHEPKHRYAVAWLDALSSGARLGRGILTLGDHAHRPEVPLDRRSAPLEYTSSCRIDVPINLPAGLLNATAVRPFNQWYYARQRSREVQRVEAIDPFFYPLDMLGRWNRLYGRQGFVQYQCVLPADESYAGVMSILNHLHRSGPQAFLAVLKRMGPADGGYLSFPMRGYTLALDLPRRPGISTLLATLDEIVCRRGGRVYLAKDAFLTADRFRAMYPRWSAWLDVKKRVDPHNRFASDQARRLQLLA